MIFNKDCKIFIEDVDSSSKTFISSQYGFIQIKNISIISSSLNNEFLTFLNITNGNISMTELNLYNYLISI